VAKFLITQPAKIEIHRQTGHYDYSSLQSTVLNNGWLIEPQSPLPDDRIHLAA